MSNLKHLTYEELCKEEKAALRYIGQLTGKINNQETRLCWIRHYKEGKALQNKLLAGCIYKFEHENHRTLSYYLWDGKTLRNIYSNSAVTFPEQWTVALDDQGRPIQLVEQPQEAEDDIV